MVVGVGRCEDQGIGWIGIVVGIGVVVGVGVGVVVGTDDAGK